MELATRVFDVVTDIHNTSESVRKSLEELSDLDQLRYWRMVLRMAALCHDIGHLPFSHAAESGLLPEGWNHETIARLIIESSEMQDIWDEFKPPLKASDIAMLAVGPEKVEKNDFGYWQSILAGIITGDALGVDRMDYLLRDSRHAGVEYGRFDHSRLIDTLRILLSPNSDGPALGLQEGGLHSAEALMLARYFMFSQVYCHPVRRIYDIHLMDFLKEWLPGGKFPEDIQELLALTDNEVNAAILDAARDEGSKFHKCSRRMFNREHFRLVHKTKPSDMERSSEAGEDLFCTLCEEFGEDNFKRDIYVQKGNTQDFPVELRNGEVVSSLSQSVHLNRIPAVAFDNVFADSSVYDDAVAWLKANREQTISQTG